MASSSISLPQTWNVFTSFHGPDVRKSFLTHLRKQFASNGISMFDDQRIERSHVIAPALTQAIRGSRISIVLLSKNYASSSWCLDELVEIFKCKEDIGQIVMTVFYGVDPSDVRKQTGDFGIAFDKMCVGNTEKKRREWSQALNDAGNIAGFDFQNCDNEAEKIEKIAKDVLDKLVNATTSTDFDDMVGLEAHLTEMISLLDLDDGGVKWVAITGPAGIGKTTIARALQSRLSGRFQLTHFVDNSRGNCDSGSDLYGLKLRLQEQFLSKVLNLDGLKISHLGAAKDMLRDQKVLIILDDVNNLYQLEALVGDISWFGPGSRIVVTTKNKQLLQNHGINNTYHVGFPSDKQALEILCRYAFKQSYPHNGFEKLAERVTQLCGKLPLGLSVVGSSLLRMNEKRWEGVINRLNTSLDHPDIEQVLRVGFESLHENDQSLFLHIAVFFIHQNSDLVKGMLGEENKEDLDIDHGLEILVDRCLIYKTTDGKIVMHRLLQQVATKVVREEPWKHMILTDTSEISDVLERAKGTRAVSSISYDISDIDAVSISERAFKRMPNLRFLKVYKSKADGNAVLHIPKKLKLPRLLRLLDWEAYPFKCLPPTFHLECLVELNMQYSKLEYLWKGTKYFWKRTKVLANLKRMDLSGSYNLKELPDLSYCPNLEELDLSWCFRLVKLPSSMGNLRKLELLQTLGCYNLQFVPLFKLASLKTVSMLECWQLRKIPDISEKIRSLSIVDTMLKEVPDSFMHWSCLTSLYIYGSAIEGLAFEVKKYFIDLRAWPNIEKIPDWIKGLQGLKALFISCCPKLASFSEFPVSLILLTVDTCKSLETVSIPPGCQIGCLYFFNCINLSREAQREITYYSPHSSYVCFPGKTMPEDFDHRAVGNSLTIQSDCKVFRICVVLSPILKNTKHDLIILCRVHINGCLNEVDMRHAIFNLETEHLFIFPLNLVYKDGWREQDNEIVFEFITTYQEVDVVECGVKILTDETYRSISSEGGYDLMEAMSLMEASEDLTRYYSDLLNIFELTLTICISLVAQAIIFNTQISCEEDMKLGLGSKDKLVTFPLLGECSYYLFCVLTLEEVS